MVGLEAGTNSRLAVIGGILTIAIADAASDALGIHISEESENVHTRKEIWISTIATFVAKAVFASLFIIPILVFELKTAILVSIAVGLLIISIASYRIARDQKEKPWKVIGEHVLVMTGVLIVAHYLGKWISRAFE